MPLVFPAHTVTMQQERIDSLKSIVEATTDSTERIDALTLLAFLLYRTSPEETRSYATRALDQAETIRYPEGVAQANNILGIYFWSRGEYQGALRHLLRSLQGFRDLNDSSNVANVSLNIGAIYNSLSNYQKALDHFLFSARFFDTLGDMTSKAQAYNNIAVILKNQGEYDRALEYYTESMSIFHERGDSIHLAMSIYNIGAVHLLRREYSDALDFFSRSLEIEKRINDVDGMANTYLSIGNVHFERGNYNEALIYFMDSLRLMRELEDKGGTAICLQNIGMLQMRFRRYDVAETYLTEALTMSREIGVRNTEKTTLLTLSNLEEIRGNFESALRYHRIYTALKDSLFNVEKSELLTEMQTKYETERMEEEIRVLTLDQEAKSIELERKEETVTRQQILLSAVGLLLASTLVLSALLYRQNRQKLKTNELLAEQNTLMKRQRDELSVQRDTLRKLIATKDKFFTIIAHDLRNPFTALISITKSLSESFHEFSEADKHTYIKTVNESAERVYRLLENLLKWARSQTGDIEFRSEEIQLEKSARRCLEVLEYNARKKNLTISLLIDPHLSVYADRNMLETVLRNLVDNAIKFSDSYGTITVASDVDDTTATISVADEGIGISEDDLHDIFSIEAEHKHIGSSKEKGTGLGLILCKEFVELNRGTIWVESVLGKGSTFYITLPTTCPDSEQS